MWACRTRGIINIRGYPFKFSCNVVEDELINVEFIFSLCKALTLFKALEDSSIHKNDAAS